MPIEILKHDIERLIPHKGVMCLLEHVLAWDTTHIRLATRTHTDKANPLQSPSGLRAVNLCEYGAQAMAVHGALVSSQQSAVAKPGLLVSLRAVRFYCEYIHQLPNELIVHAQCLHASEALLQYEFRVQYDEVLLAEGRAAVVLQDS